MEFQKVIVQELKNQYPHLTDHQVEDIFMKAISSDLTKSIIIRQIVELCEDVELRNYYDYCYDF